MRSERRHCAAVPIDAPRGRRATDYENTSISIQARFRPR